MSEENAFKSNITGRVVSDACGELIEEYKTRLRRKFSQLIYASVKALNTKLRRQRDKNRFIQDLERQYNIRNSKSMDIGRLLDTICKKRNWGLKKYRGLFDILKNYVDEETFALRENYKDLVTGLYEVQTFFDRYKQLVKIKYAHTLQVYCKVPPETIDKIKKLWRDICERFELPPLKALLYDKRYSSLLLTWLIDTDEGTSKTVRKLLLQYLPAGIQFLQENNITHLIYNFEVLQHVSCSFHPMFSLYIL